MTTEQLQTDRLERQSVLILAATAVGVLATVAFFVLGSLAEAGAL